jgi:hypothetical protein
MTTTTTGLHLRLLLLQPLDLRRQPGTRLFVVESGHCSNGDAVILVILVLVVVVADVAVVVCVVVILALVRVVALVLDLLLLLGLVRRAGSGKELILWRVCVCGRGSVNQSVSQLNEAGRGEMYVLMSDGMIVPQLHRPFFLMHPSA